MADRNNVQSVYVVVILKHASNTEHTRMCFTTISSESVHGYTYFSESEGFRCAKTPVGE